jgi:anthranilate synthase/aminodeoxychorismate synthase-like glutamine amidotransferase
VRVLFLENDDSFSWNLVDALPVERACVTLVHTRQQGVRPGLLAGADVLVVGPGPMDPERVGLLEGVREAARRGLPMLGVCLGHQALGLAFGARLVRVPPVHGKCSRVAFGPARLFPGFTGPEVVMRYHSLALAGVAPPLRVVAATDDGVPMALEHESLPMAGVQFHPDSYATPRGRALLEAFFRATVPHLLEPRREALGA